MLFCLVCLAVFFVDIYLLVKVHYHALEPGIALLLHGLLLFPLAGWAQIDRKTQGDARFSWLLVLTTSVLGPLGAAGTLVSYVLYRIYARNATSFEEWHSSLFPEDEIHPTSRLAEKIKLAAQSAPTDADVVPFMDILAFGTQHQKLEVILRMTRQFRSEFAPALRLALNDESNSVRVQAATAIAKIESDFMNRTTDLTAALAKSPNNPDSLLALARHYDDYAFTGLLEPQRESENRAQALFAYREYIKHRPEDREAWRAAGRILMREERYAEAADWFEQSIRTGLATPQMLIWYMESLSNLGRLQDLRLLARTKGVQWTIEGGFSPEVPDMVRLWAQGYHPEKDPLVSRLAS